MISATLLPNLLYLDDHFAPASEHLVYTVEELKEEFLASEDEAGSMSLADEDATLAQTERTIARLKHGTRKGMKLIQAPEPHDSCAPGGKARRFRGEEEESRRSKKNHPLTGSRKSIWRAKHLAFSHHDVIFTRLQTATLALHRITNVLMACNDTLAINYFLTKATNNGAMISTKTI